MKTLTMTRNRFFLLIVLYFVCGSSNLAASAANVPVEITFDENISVYTSDITGLNTVKVVFFRTGADAGLYGVWVTYSVRFNSGSSSEVVDTFQVYLSPNSTYYEDTVAGPIPTGDAEVIDVVLNYEI